MPERLDFRWGGERGRKRGQFESARTKFPQAFFFFTGRCHCHKVTDFFKRWRKRKITQGLDNLTGTLHNRCRHAAVTLPVSFLAGRGEGRKKSRRRPHPPQPATGRPGPSRPAPAGPAPTAGTSAFAADAGGAWETGRTAGTGLLPRSYERGTPRRGCHPRCGGLGPAHSPGSRRPRPAQTGPAAPPHTHPAEPSGGPPVSLPPPHTHTPPSPSRLRPPGPAAESPGHGPAPPNRRPRPLRHLSSAPGGRGPAPAPPRRLSLAAAARASRRRGRASLPSLPIPAHRPPTARPSASCERIRIIPASFSSSLPHSVSSLGSGAASPARRGC